MSERFANLVVLQQRLVRVHCSSAAEISPAQGGACTLLQASLSLRAATYYVRVNKQLAC